MHTDAASIHLCVVSTNVCVNRNFQSFSSAPSIARPRSADLAVVGREELRAALVLSLGPGDYRAGSFAGRTPDKRVILSHRQKRAAPIRSADGRAARPLAIPNHRAGGNICLRWKRRASACTAARTLWAPPSDGVADRGRFRGKGCRISPVRGAAVGQERFEFPAQHVCRAISSILFGRIHGEHVLVAAAGVTRRPAPRASHSPVCQSPGSAKAPPAPYRNLREVADGPWTTIRSPWAPRSVVRLASLP